MEKRTTTISIPQCVAADTLQKMEENKITCQYEGVDQSGRIVMKVNYLSDQDGYLKKLIRDMEEGERSVTLLLEISGLLFMNEIVKAKTAAFLEQIPKRNGSK